MKSNFRFNKDTGTMESVNGAPMSPEQSQVEEVVKDMGVKADVDKPAFSKDKTIINSSDAQFIRPEVVNMKRVNALTNVQLVGENGLPEAYLDSVTTGVVMFREREDYALCQIVDEKTNKALCYIGGYALQINFNMEELNTMEKIEQCLQGLTKLFRHKIMTQNLTKK